MDIDEGNHGNDPAPTLGDGNGLLADVEDAHEDAYEDAHEDAHEDQAGDDEEAFERHLEQDEEGHTDHIDLIEASSGVKESAF
eukprot:scaffold3173_cov242-Pinguiococcus_pyrenoidosus.AAC.8